MNLLMLLDMQKKSSQKNIKMQKNVASQFYHDYVICKILVLVKITIVLKCFLRNIVDFYFFKNN